MVQVGLYEFAANGFIVLFIVFGIGVQLKAQQGLDAFAASGFIANLGQTTEPGDDKDANHEHA